MAFNWGPWSTHDGYLIADCGELRGEWPTYAPTQLPSGATRVGTLVCLPPASGSVDDVLNASYPTPYVWAERVGTQPAQTTGEYTPAASGGYAGSLTDPPPRMHVYALWYDPSTPVSPSGDTFAVPRQVYITNGTYQSEPIDNTAFTTETGEPVPSASGQAYHTCWWTYTPLSTGTCTINTELSSAPSGADTVLAVYTGSAVNALTQVASDDDSGIDYTSFLSFTANAGVTYHIQASSYAQAAPVTSLVLSVAGPETAAAPASPDEGGPPSLTPLQLVPRGMVAGSTGPPRGDRKTGHWSEWQPAVDQSFTVLPDNGGDANQPHHGCFVSRYIKNDEFLTTGYTTGHPYLVDYLEAQHQLLTDLDFVEIPPSGGSGLNGAREQDVFHQAAGFTEWFANGKILFLTGILFSARIWDLETYASPEANYGRTDTNVGMAAVSYRGSQWRTDSLSDRTQELEYGVDYLPAPATSGYQSGNTYYEADQAGFLRWEPFEVDVASIGSNFRTEPSDASQYRDQEPFLPTQPLALRFARVDYEPLPGDSTHLLSWKPYDEGTTIQTLDLGYLEGNPTTGSQTPLGYLQELSTTLDFGAETEDVTILIQPSTTGVDPLPLWDDLDFPSSTTPDPNPVANESRTRRSIAVDGMPLTFTALESISGFSPAVEQTIVTRPTPFPRVTYQIPRWRYWVPGPTPASISLTPLPVPAGRLQIADAGRPPINIW